MKNKDYRHSERSEESRFYQILRRCAPQNDRIRYFTTVLLVLLFMNISALGHAQNAIEENSRREMDKAPAYRVHQVQNIVYEHGLWSNYYYLHYKDSDNDRRSKDSLTTYQKFDGRFWFKMTHATKVLREKGYSNSIYVRIKNAYIHRAGSAPGARNDVDGPHVDYAYVQLNYQPVYIEAGRRYFAVGRGLVFNDVQDGVKLDYRRLKWNMHSIYARTLPHQDNIDYSIPGGSKSSDRQFYGLGFAITGIKDQEIYTYFLKQHDDSKPTGATIRDYDYQSQYLGLGAKGIIGKHVDYGLEGVYQTGKSRIFTTNAQSDIKAYAFDGELGYQSFVYGNPRLSMEYIYASGDADRDNVTNTQNGNAAGKDRNFLGFGYIPTGYALAPSVSNIHIYRTGVSINPFMFARSLKNVSMDINYFRFYKDQKTGAISDSQATAFQRYIGQEIDMLWQVPLFTDVHLGLYLGYFKPGKAYAPTAHADEKYVGLSITFQF